MGHSRRIHDQQAIAAYRCLKLLWNAQSTHMSFKELHSPLLLDEERTGTHLDLNDPICTAAPTTMDSEAYTLVTTTSHHQNFEDYVDANSGKAYNLNVYLQAALRRQYPELALTATYANDGIYLLPLLPPCSLTTLLI